MSVISDSGSNACSISSSCGVLVFVYLFLPFSILHNFFGKLDMMYWVKEQVYRPLRDCFIFIWLAVRPCLLWLCGQRLKLPLMSLFLSPLFSLGFPGDCLNSVMVNFNVST